MEKLTDKLASLKKAYLNKIKDNILIFKEIKDCSVEAEKIYDMVHKISGTSGMYGFSEISKLSTEFEFFLKGSKNKVEEDIKQAMKSKFKNYIENLEKLVVKEGENHA